MDRRQLLAALLALGVQPVLRAQNKGPTIALLWIEPERPSPFIAALVQGLREHGYTPGRNIRVDERYLVAGYTELQGAAERLVREKPDIIVTFGGTALQAARKATNSVPIVMVSGGDPVKLGIVKSLSRPGGNVTGLVTLTSDLSGKRLELLKEGFPGIKRIAVALSPLSETELTELKNYERAARNLNLDLYVAEIRTADDIAPTIAGLQSKGVEAITFVGSSLFIANRARIAAAVAKTRLPAIYTNEMFTEAGG